jgi:2-polyprenyl-6-methoxyphenol hydroxylase-like FAD-dependent oxidoreductase
MHDVEVLIAGGGPVGLTASILLSRLGITSLLVERHPGTSLHPKARGINARTMEIFRQCGVEAAVRAAGLAPGRSGFIVWTRSLAGEELERRIPARSRAEAQQISPVLRCLCAQDDLEPVLRAHAESLAPGQLRFGTELAEFRQDADHVGATLRDSGDETTICARYLIAADGARSRVREALGIPMRGTPGLYRSINVLLRADLTPWVADRPAALYFVEQPGLKATFLTINGVNRWGFLINNLPVNGPDEYTPERCAAIVRQAAGVPDLDLEILGAVPWVAAAQVAERYRDGRVFLAGDAAHHMPPTGGFGLNTGVQDVHNLAWKLAAVLNGWAGPGLLTSYEDERLPYGRAITEQSLANARSLGRGEATDAAPAAGTALARPEFLNELGMIFGASYASDGVIPDGTPPPPVANPVTDYMPTGRPGARAPHAWIERSGDRLSTLDLFGERFVLLAGPGGSAWRDAAATVAGSLTIPLTAFTVGADADLSDPTKEWATLYGTGPEGAVLVRPDGHVAWRCGEAAANPHRDLAAVLRRLLATAA